MGTDGPPGGDPADPTDPAYWNGTLLKCPGCRLKFPFSAVKHPFELRGAGTARSGGQSNPVRVTRCPQCQGWVSII
jgi:hypothetical protein